MKKEELEKLSRNEIVDFVLSLQEEIQYSRKRMEELLDKIISLQEKKEKTYKLTLNQQDRQVILNWFEYVSVESYHRGSLTAVFPQEQILLDKLKKNSGYYKFSEREFEMISDWMDTAIRGKYSGAVYMLPEEFHLCEKLLQEADPVRFAMEKKLQKDNIESNKIEIKAKEQEGLKSKLQAISEKVAQMSIDRETHKNRSLKEKISSTKETKKMIEEIQKKYKKHNL